MAWELPTITTTSSLLGYSVALLHKACGLSYVAGAPRYKQRGAVFELQKEGKETNFVPVLEGEQVLAGEGCPHYYRWRIWKSQREWDRLQGTPRGITSAWTELRQNAVPLPQLCMSGYQLASSAVGHMAAHPGF